jgi:hypothetical protein
LSSSIETKPKKRVNWTGGLLRIWVVLSAVWIVGGVLLTSAVLAGGYFYDPTTSYRTITIWDYCYGGSLRKQPFWRYDWQRPEDKPASCREGSAYSREPADTYESDLVLYEDLIALGRHPAVATTAPSGSRRGSVVFGPIPTTEVNRPGFSRH